MKSFITPLLVGVIALAFSCSAFAGATPKPTPPVRHTVIASISADSVTVDTGRSTQTYKIDKHTQLMFDGKTVPMSALKAGMKVTVTPGGFDGKTASSVNASPAPKATPAASPSPTPKK